MMTNGPPDLTTMSEDGADTGEMAAVKHFPMLEIPTELLRHLMPNPTIEYAGGQEGWVVTAPEYRGCIGTGITQASALDDFYSALQEWLSLSASKKLPVPPAASELMNGVHRP